MIRRIALLLVLCIFSVNAALADPYVRIRGIDQATACSNSNPIPAQPTSPAISTYAASSGYFTPYATPTDIITISGSSTTTVKVTRVTLSSTQTTAGINNWFLNKLSAADTGGTSTGVTAVPMDSANAAATASVLKYTVIPTPGTTVGTVRSVAALSPAASSVYNGEITLFDDQFTGQPIVLRGIAQTLNLNYAGAAVPAGLSMCVNVYWTEQ